MIRIQAVWRGFALRRHLPSYVAALWVQFLCRSIRSSMPLRMQAKAYMRARNLRIHDLRLEVARLKVGITKAFWSVGRLERAETELRKHQRNTRHILRATIFAQAWWRGCLARGAKGRSD